MGSSSTELTGTPGPYLAWPWVPGAAHSAAPQPPASIWASTGIQTFWNQESQRNLLPLPHPQLQGMKRGHKQKPHRLLSTPCPWSYHKGLWKQDASPWPSIVKEGADGHHYPLISFPTGALSVNVSSYITALSYRGDLVRGS